MEPGHCAASMTLQALVAETQPPPARGTRTMGAAIDSSYALLDEPGGVSSVTSPSSPSSFELDPFDALLPLSATSKSTWCWRRSSTTSSCASSNRLAPVARDHPAFALERLASAASTTPRSSTIGAGRSRRRPPPPGSIARCRSADRPPASGCDGHQQAFSSSINAGHVDDAVELVVARSFLWRTRWAVSTATAGSTPSPAGTSHPAPRPGSPSSRLTSPWATATPRR